MLKNILNLCERSRLAVFSFYRRFLAFRNFSHSVLRQNFTITCSLYLSQWQHPNHLYWRCSSKFEKIGTSSIQLRNFGKPTISRVSLLEYWAFAQHYLSVATDQITASLDFLQQQRVNQVCQVFRSGISILSKL